MNTFRPGAWLPACLALFLGACGSPPVAGPDAGSPGLDAHAAGSDVGTSAPDSGVPGEDAALTPDAAEPGEDAAAPGPDAAHPGLDAAQAGADAAAINDAAIAKTEDCTGPSYSLASDFAEGNAEYWDLGSQDMGEVHHQVHLESARVKEGASAIRLSTQSGLVTVLTFPATRAAAWDLSRAQALHVWLRPENPNGSGFMVAGPEIRLGRNGGGSFVYRPSADRLTPANHQWVELTVPLAGSAEWLRTTTEGGVSLDRIDFLELRARTWGTAFELIVDDLSFTGAPAEPQCLPALAAPDLDVVLIERTPRYPRYQVQYTGAVPTVTNAAVQHAPKVGEQVTWKGYVANKSPTAAGPFSLRWLVDGVEVSREDLLGLAAGARLTRDLAWTWQDGPHRIALEVDPENRVAEVGAVNNRLEVRSDAWTFGFVVEDGTCARLDATFNAKGSRSCEDWLQRATAENMTRLMAESTYAFAPQGALTAVRIDKITRVADGTLPPDAWNDPVDLEVDGVWGFRAATSVEYSNLRSLVDTNLLHELNHKLGLIDLYFLNIEPSNNQVDGQRYYWPTEGGLMAGGDVGTHTVAHYSDHDVWGLNSTRGFRRGHFGEYLYSLPATCRVRVVDAAGAAVAGVGLRLFQKDLASVVDATPELTGTTDAQGVFTLPNRPAPQVTTLTGHVLRENPFGELDPHGANGVFLVELVKTGKPTAHAVLRVTDYNLAFARGETTVATVELRAPGW